MTRFSLVVVAFCAPSAAAALLNTCWKLDLDLGQERGSWMPPTWGKSGARARATPVVEFTDDNSVRLLGSGAWDHLTVKWRTVDGSEDDSIIGRWSIDGERVRFFLEHDGIERNDVILEPGQLWCTAGAWGNLLQKRGTLTIKQRKFGWMPFLPAPREASFLVGVFTSKAEARADESSVATGSPPRD